jgi:hypothetical protein
MNPYPTINLGGVERPISFGMAAMATFSKETNISINEMFLMAQNMRLDHILTLAFAGLKDGARKAKQEFSFTNEDVADWFDADPNGMEKIGEVMNIYVEQTVKPETNAKKKQVAKKKK